MRPTGALLGRLALAPVAVVGVLAGCGGGHEAADQDQQFIDKLVDAKVIPADASQDARQALIDQGRGWCRDLQDPDTRREDVEAAMAHLVATSDTETALKGTLTLGAASQVYCPEDAARFE